VVYGLTTLTSLGFYGKKEDGMFVEEAGEWVLDLSRLPTLTWLRLAGCYAVTVKEVLALRNVTSLTYLGLSWCYTVASEGLRAVSGLPSLTFLDLNGCDKVTAAGVQALRNTTAAPSLRIDWYPPPEVEEYEEDEEDEEVCP
jgi:hypothetical protein